MELEGLDGWGDRKGVAVNIYTTKFFALCPSNSVRIEYELEIVTDEMILVENILSEVNSIISDYHESIADRLQDRFGGKQKLTANHHGVEIVTLREEY